MNARLYWLTLRLRSYKKLDKKVWWLCKNRNWFSVVEEYWYGTLWIRGAFRFFRTFPIKILSCSSGGNKCRQLVPALPGFYEGYEMKQIQKVVTVIKGERILLTWNKLHTKVFWLQQLTVICWFQVAFFGWTKHFFKVLSLTEQLVQSLFRYS